MDHVSLDLLDLCYPDKQPYHYRGYQIRWRGWLQDQRGEQVVACWLGWPLSQYLPFEGTIDGHPVTAADLPRRWPYLVAVVGGRSVGQYRRGQAWDIRPPEGKSPIKWEDFQTPCGLVRTTLLRAEAKAAVVKMVDNLWHGEWPPVVPLVTVTYTHAETGDVLP